MRNASNSEQSGNSGTFVGTCGFSYSDWVGPFYPRGLRPTEWFQHYCAEFRSVEVNSTFYSWLAPQSIASFADRSPDGFRFALKLHQSMTHEPGPLMPVIRKTLDQAEPLVKSGKFAVYLAQFPNSFQVSREAWDRIHLLAEHLRPLCVEFRRAEWSNQATVSSLRSLGVAQCTVDAPQLSGLFGFSEAVTSDIAYIRLHGRNVEKWYDHEHSWERYDYTYSPHEIQELARSIKRMTPEAKETYVFFNNHYAAQAITNARQMANALGVPTTPVQQNLF